MCGIVGFTGAAQAAPILLDGLAKLEYRGYDSAGMAVQNAAGKIEVVKAKGRLKVLSEMTDGGSAVPGSCGIGHTRWATHGEPSVVNAHPHYSRDQKIAVVHNGIIENYQEIKERLINKGFSFVSQTDTEVVAQLLDYYYMGESAGNALDAITRMMLHVRGSYALGVLFADEPGVIYAVRKDSPLIVGKCEDGAIIASDVPALLKYTRTVYYIDNLEIARLTPDSIEFFNIDKEPITRESTTIEWDAEAAEKGGYEHFMMKEIYEQPAAVRDTISPRLKDGQIDLSELALDEEAIRNVHRLYIIGCGSASKTRSIDVRILSSCGFSSRSALSENVCGIGGISTGGSYGASASFLLVLITGADFTTDAGIGFTVSVFGGGFSTICCGFTTTSGLYGSTGRLACCARSTDFISRLAVTADFTPWYTASNTGRSFTKRTSSFAGCTFTSTTDDGSSMCSTHAGNLPTIIAPLYASSSATHAVRLRTKRPLMKKFCMLRFGRLAIGDEIYPCTRMPPKV